MATCSCATLFGALAASLVWFPAGLNQAVFAQERENAQKADDDEAEKTPKTDTPKSTEKSARAVKVVIRKRPDVFAIDDPKTSDEDWKQWYQGSKRAVYNNKVSTGDRDAESLRIITDGIQRQIKAMTLPSQRDRLGTLVADLLRQAHGAAQAKDAAEQKAFRENVMMKEIVAGCKEYLEDNQFYVRLNAAVLLGNLFTVLESPTNHVDAEFYAPAFGPLMDILEKPGQLDAIKLATVKGLMNAALHANPPLQPTQKIRLAKRLIAELLDSPNADELYLEKLCESLGLIDQIFDLDGKPFIVEALGKALFDRNRPFCVRAAAAKAFGRAPWPPSIDLNVVSYGIADLSRQMMEARNSDSRKRIRRWCVLNVLFAFKPTTPEKGQRVGLIDRVQEPTYRSFQKTVNEVYRAIKPMIIQELKSEHPNSAFPSEALAPVSEWIKNNVPPSPIRIAPGLAPLSTTQITNAESPRTNAAVAP